MILVLVLGGCTDRSDESAEPDFNDPYEIAFRHMVAADEPFGAVVSLDAEGGHIFASDPLADLHIVVINRRDGTVHARFGRNGAGPNEYRMPIITDVHQIDAGRYSLSIWDGRAGVADYGVYDAASGAGDFSRMRLTDRGRQFHTVIRDGSGAIGNRIVGQPRVVSFDSTGTVIGSVNGVAPYPPNEGGDRAILNLNRMRTNGDWSRVVLAYKYAPKLDVIHVVDGTVQTFGKDVDPGIVDALSRGEMPGYWDAQIVDERVFGLFKRPGDDFPRRLHVYDLSGLLVADFDLGRPVIEMAIPPNDSVLYGAVAEPVPGVGEWVLRR